MIKPPVVIDTRGGLLVFGSAAKAERELAVEDVRAGAYPAAYDMDGRLLRIEVKQRERRILGVFREVTPYVRIVECEHVPTHDQELHRLLARFIQARNHRALVGIARG